MISRELQLELAVWTAANERARRAYHEDPAPGMCLRCGVAPRYRNGSMCNPCKHRARVERKWAA